MMLTCYWHDDLLLTFEEMSASELLSENVTTREAIASKNKDHFIFTDTLYSLYIISLFVKIDTIVSNSSA